MACKKGQDGSVLQKIDSFWALGGPLRRHCECPKGLSRRSTLEAQASKQARLGPGVEGLASRIQEIFPNSHQRDIEERVQQLLGGATSSHLVDAFDFAFDRITEELLQEKVVKEGGVKVEIKDEAKSELTAEQKQGMSRSGEEALARREIKEEELWSVFHQF